jgi:glyoxylase-like metal-dependent hydrolase (beta-lactamase superfamily II)
MISVQHHDPVIAFRMARTFLGRPIYWTTAYWVDGLLIDSGPPVTARQLVSALQDLGVQQIVVTHAHEDHIGGLYELQRAFPHAPIYAALRTLPFIEEPSLLHQQLYRRLVWGVPKPVLGVLPLETEVKTPNHTFRVLETPGHSPDHVSFFEPERRWLFCGDAFVGGRDRAWSPEAEMFGAISSLRAMAALHPRRLFPGSGNVRQTALAELQGRLGYLLSLCRDVARLDGMGLSDEEIVVRLFGGEPSIHLWTMGHFSAINLIRTCRRYNEIVSNEPAQVVAADGSKQSGSSSKSSGSSTSRSTGRGDRIR